VEKYESIKEEIIKKQADKNEPTLVNHQEEITKQYLQKKGIVVHELSEKQHEDLKLQYIKKKEAQ